MIILALAKRQYGCPDLKVIDFNCSITFLDLSSFYLNFYPESIPVMRQKIKTKLTKRQKNK